MTGAGGETARRKGLTMAIVTQPIPSQARPIYEQISRSPALKEIVRFLIAIALASAVFSIHSDSAIEKSMRDLPSTCIIDAGEQHGRSELTEVSSAGAFAALAVAIPARVGLVNVGGEGQLYIGAWLASWPALTFTDLPIYVLIPIMIVMGMIGGGLLGADSGHSPGAQVDGMKRSAPCY